MSAGELVIRSFNARTGAHIAHFQTLSYAQHKALNDFYDDILEAIDDWAENYQGIFGLITDYPMSQPIPTGNPVAWMEAEHAWLKANRANCCKGETQLENLFDTIKEAYSHALYKLKFLDNPAMRGGAMSGNMGSMKDWC
jgi:hypothetical protein